MGRTFGVMDQQAASLDLGNASPVRAAALPAPLRPFPLTLSLFGIAAGALFICCLLAVASMLAFVVDIGKDGISDFYQELRFDTVLRTQVGAFVVSALYIGLVIATLTAAVLRGKRYWTSLVALTPVGRWRELAVISVATIFYITSVTYVLEHARDRHLLISGPTDLLLLGTIVINLAILAPLAEELLFRGWFYTGLRQSLGFLPSFLFTVTLFAAIHWDPNHRRILQVLPLAIALGLLRERSGSIKPTIILHAAYNLIIIAIRLAYT